MEFSRVEKGKVVEVAIDTTSDQVTVLWSLGPLATKKHLYNRPTGTHTTVPYGKAAHFSVSERTLAVAAAQTTDPFAEAEFVSAAKRLPYRVKRLEAGL
jgi:hypothetical protein